MRNEAGGSNRTNPKALTCREKRVTNAAGAGEPPEAFHRGVMKGDSRTGGQSGG